MPLLQQFFQHLRHINTHTKERHHWCNICDETSTRGCYLKAHMKKHAHDGNFRCINCEIEFNNSEQADLHYTQCKKETFTPILQRHNSKAHKKKRAYE